MILPFPPVNAGAVIIHRTDEPMTKDGLTAPARGNPQMSGIGGFPYYLYYGISPTIIYRNKPLADCTILLQAAMQKIAYAVNTICTYLHNRPKARVGRGFLCAKICLSKSFKLARCMLFIYVDRITETRTRSDTMRDLVETRWNPIQRVLKVVRNGNRPAYFRTTVILANYDIRVFDLRHGQIHQIMNEIGQSNVKGI